MTQQLKPKAELAPELVTEPEAEHAEHPELDSDAVAKTMAVRQMRLDDETWDELRRVGQLNGVSRAGLVRALALHVLSRVRSIDDLRALLYSSDR